MHDRTVAGFSAPASGWLADLGERLAHWRDGRRGIRLMNVGDSIATGQWGITSSAQHAVAVAASLLAHEITGPTGAMAAGAHVDDERIGFFGAPGTRLAPAPAAGSVDWFTSGIGGGRIRDLERHLARGGGSGYDAYAEACPDLLTVWIGVNDSIHADEESLDGSARSLRRIVAGLTSRAVPVALISANPVRASHQPGPWRVEESVERIYAPVAREFALPLLDLVHRWGNYGGARQAGYLRDQVHPTALGHADVAFAVAALVSGPVHG